MLTVLTVLTVLTARRCSPGPFRSFYVDHTQASNGATAQGGAPNRPPPDGQTVALTQPPLGAIKLFNVPSQPGA